jgi:hypothetical protein
VGRFWCLVICAACARGAGAGGGADLSFAISYPDAPATGTRARHGKRFYAKPEARCFYDNGREARWTMSGARVASGELPPGLTLEDGVIGGIPTRSGTYRFHIELSGVTCAGTSYGDQGVDVQITAQ